MDLEIASRYVPATCEECGRISKPDLWYPTPSGVRADYRCECGSRWTTTTSRVWWLHDGLQTDPHVA